VTTTTTKVFIANLTHAYHNRQSVEIGGGTFNPDELKEVIGDMQPLMQPATEAPNHAAPALTPPYRVIAGRGIVDSQDRLVARIEARFAVNSLGMVLARNEDGTSHPDRLRGMSPTEADALARDLVRVLNSHTRIVAALRRLMNAPDVHLDDIEEETCEALDEAEAALAGAPPATHSHDANLLRDIRDFWAGGDCPPDLWARIEAQLGGNASG
jgi:hypothetical protein